MKTLFLCMAFLAGSYWAGAQADYHAYQALAKITLFQDDFDNNIHHMHLSQTGFNKYTIRKIGSAYYFFVNEQYFYSMPFVPFYGNHVGVGAAAVSAISIDYLSVSYL